MEEPLLLLSGMMCDARLYGPQIAHFSSSRPVMVMSLTGHQSFASLAEAILDKAPPRFALAGLSMGGICAMEIIRHAPNRVSRLALMDTNPLPDPPERAEIRQSQVERVMAGDLREVIRDEMKPNYLADTPRKREVLDLCMEMALTLGPKVFADQSQALMHRPDQC
ncbi:MAG: alpha/beta hydrolase, partial [Pseudomonadota bacterium]